MLLPGTQPAMPLSTVSDPNACPHCHVVINPKFHWHIKGKGVISTAWSCTFDKCREPFLVEYITKDNSKWVFNRFLNGLPKGLDWPEPVRNLKDAINPDNQTKFIKTYQQSLVAESSGLDEIAGMGFRKAIEYLVKDWTANNNQEAIEQIKKQTLGQVIANFFDGDLKEILKRATWLGNDQTHYHKIFEEYDISILKELIMLIMVLLDRQFKMKHFIETIENRK